MRADNGGPKQVTANLAFSAFLFSIFGWALFETQLFNLAAGVRVHLLTSACGCVISATAFRRCRLSWLLFVDADAVVGRLATNRYHIGDVGSCVALVAAGCVLALSAKPGSIALFSICAGAFSLAPWSRIVFCRRHFFISCAMLGAGAVLVCLIVKGDRDPLRYLFCAWVLWVIAISDLLITWKRDRPATLRPEPLRSYQRAHDPKKYHQKN